MDYASLFHIRAYPFAYRVAFEGIGSTKSVYINRTYRRNIDYVSRVNAGCKSNYWNLFPYNGGGAYRDTIGIFTRSKKKKERKEENGEWNALDLWGIAISRCSSNRIASAFVQRKGKKNVWSKIVTEKNYKTNRGIGKGELKAKLIRGI